MKKEINVFVMMLTVLLSFGLLVTGCDTGGGGGSSEPVNVNMALPVINSVADFEGDFVSDKEEAWALTGDALKVIMEWLEDITDEAEGGFSISSAVPNIARMVYSEPFSDTFINQEIADGVRATGYVQGYYKVSMANEGYQSKGDYFETLMKIKFAFDFDDAVQGGVTIHAGKFTVSESMYYKEQITLVDPYKADYTNKINVSEGYAMSLSKGGKGLKCVITLSATLDHSIPNATDEEYYNAFENTGFNSFLFKVDIYDNDNVLKFTQTFSEEEAESYFGL